jgi:hypothetical protein
MFLRILVAAWILYLASTVLVFLFPKPMLRVLLPLGFRYGLPILVLMSGVYGVLRLYRAGMMRAQKRGDS